MKLVLEIPKEFERHYLNDKFEDSLKRLLSDTFSNRDSEVIYLSGLYEKELLEMLIKSFKSSEEL